MAIVRKALVYATTTTTGTGTYTIGSAVAGYRAFTVISDGDQVHYMAKDASGNFERGLGTKGGGGSPTLARTTIYESSTGTSAINWGAGTRDIYTIDEAELALLSANNLSDVASAATAKVNLAILPSGQSGGTDGKIVRLSAANTWTDASQADTAVQLSVMAFKQGGFYYPPGSFINGLSSLTAGTTYFLDTAGGWTASDPTPSSSLRRVAVLFANSTTSALFNPDTIIGGV